MALSHSYVTGLKSYGNMDSIRKEEIASLQNKSPEKRLILSLILALSLFGQSEQPRRKDFNGLTEWS